MNTSAAADTATGSSRWRTSSPWYLVYLGLLVFQPLFDPSAGPLDWAVVMATVAVFVPLYLTVERGSGMRRRWAPIASTLLGLAVLPFNTGGSVLFVYAAGFAGAYRRREVAARWLAGLSVLTGVLALVSPVPMPYRLAAFLPPLIFVWVVGLSTMEEAARDREAARLRLDNARIAHLATASERERIARDLHDLTGHSLTSVIVRAQLVQRLVERDPERATAEAAAIERVARAALGEVRETLSGWRQVVLDDELRVAADALQRVGVELVVSRDPDLQLAPSVEQALGLALREAVTNVVRHAGATHCEVSLRHVDGEIRLQVIDDGIGGGTTEGNGLTGMRERISVLGGRVDRVVRSGTQLTVAVPEEIAG